MIPAPPSLGRVLGAHWSAEALPLALLCAAGAAYLGGVALHVARGRRWPAWRACSFLAGLATIALALLSGIDFYADYLLSIHMVEHMLLLLLAPPLLLWGAPVRLALGASRGRARRAIARALHSRVVSLVSRPLFALVAFALVVLGVELTGLFELSLRNQTVHELEHGAYLLAGLLLFAPLVGADPLPNPPGTLGRFSLMMAAMTVMTIPGAMLTFAHSVWYPYYIAASHAVGHSALSDQASAGAIMWVGGGIVMLGLSLLFAMQGMLREERRQRRRELHQDAAAGRVGVSAGDGLGELYADPGRWAAS
ncbi:MAG: cytochrome c oxidase assembly protein [Solirubrobacteraceae bacterium]